MHNLIAYWGSKATDERDLQVNIPSDLVKELAAAMKEAGIPLPDSEKRWRQAFRALKVWLLLSTSDCSSAQFKSVEQILTNLQSIPPDTQLDGEPQFLKEI